MAPQEIYRIINNLFEADFYDRLGEKQKEADEKETEPSMRDPRVHGGCHVVERHAHQGSITGHGLGIFGLSHLMESYSFLRPSKHQPALVAPAYQPAPIRGDFERAGRTACKSNTYP